MFVSNEMKIKLKSILFQSLFDLEPAIEIRQVHKRFITLLITLFFWHDVIKLLDYIFSLANARDKNKSEKAPFR